MFPSENHDLYERLQITKESSSDEIKSAYRKKAIEWHPDKNPDKIERAHLEFIAVSEAYEVLSDSLKKRNYDSTNHYSSYYSEHASNKEYEERRRATEEAFKFYEDICEEVFGKDSVFSHILKMPEVRLSFWLFSDIYKDFMKGNSNPKKSTKKIEQ